MFIFEKLPHGSGIIMNTSGCSDCYFKLAEGNITSTGIELMLSFDTKPERDRVVGTLQRRGCEITWTTNSTSSSGHWGHWYRRGAEPAQAFNAGTRGYAACGDPANFTAFNDYNSTVAAIASLEYAVHKGEPFFVAMGVFKPHCKTL